MNEVIFGFLITKTAVGRLIYIGIIGFIIIPRAVVDSGIAINTFYGFKTSIGKPNKQQKRLMYGSIFSAKGLG